jgi:regulator of sirC expression with transglutaminase-like and TPR domain
VTPLEDLLRDNDETVTLDVAALEIAEVEYPDLNPAPFFEILDSHARELNAMCPRGSSGADFVRAANLYLFDQLGFRGNETDYYAPSNSCLNEVLTSRAGIPITLSIVYMEIARRAGRSVHGIGLPGHFVVRYCDEEFDSYIDPYHSGRILDAGDCRDLAFQLTGVDLNEKPELLEPATNWQIAVRMLHNLRGIYARKKEYGKLLRVLDWLLIAMPDSAPDRELQAQVRRYLQLMN